jgi:hypothetical protein
MVAAGLVVLALLFASKQFLLVVLTVLTTLPFTLYFPPIPAYMYGAYALLVFGVLEISERLFRRPQIGRI